MKKLLYMLLLTNVVALAAELRVDRDTINVSGFLDNSKNELFKQNLDAHPDVKRVVFRNCFGGHFGAARYYAKVIEEKNLETLISGEVHSACAIAFLAGRSRKPTNEIGLQLLHLHSGRDANGNRSDMRTTDAIMSLIDTYTDEKLKGPVRKLIEESWGPTAGVYFLRSNYLVISSSKSLYCNGSEENISKCVAIPDVDPYKVGVFSISGETNGGQNETMTNPAWILLIITVACFLGGWALLKWFSVFNSADGERYRKMRMQGPFVPLSEEDIAEGAQRKDQGN